MTGVIPSIQSTIGLFVFQTIWYSFTTILILEIWRRKIKKLIKESEIKKNEVERRLDLTEEEEEIVENNEDDMFILNELISEIEDVSLIEMNINVIEDFFIYSLERINYIRHILTDYQNENLRLVTQFRLLQSINSTTKHLNVLYLKAELEVLKTAITFFTSYFLYIY